MLHFNNEKFVHFKIANFMVPSNQISYAGSSLKMLQKTPFFFFEKSIT